MKQKISLVLTIMLSTYFSFAQNNDHNLNWNNYTSVGYTVENNTTTVDSLNSADIIQMSFIRKGFRATLGGGYAYRLGETYKTGNHQMDDLTKDLRSGFNIDFESQYFFNETWGIGLNVNYVKSSAKDNDIYIDGYGRGKYEERNSFLYLGPSVAVRSDLNKFILIGNLGVGPLFYKNSSNVILDMKKTVFAMNAGIGIEYKLSPSLGAGLKLSYTVGATKSLNIGGQSIDFEDNFSLSNLMITGFISFRTWK